MYVILKNIYTRKSNERNGKVEMKLCLSKAM